MKINNLKRNPQLLYLLDDKIVIERSSENKEIIPNNKDNFNKAKQDIIIQYEKYIKKLEKSLMFKEYSKRLSTPVALAFSNNLFITSCYNVAPQLAPIFHLCFLSSALSIIVAVNHTSSNVEEYRNALIDMYESIEETYKDYTYEDFLKVKKMFYPKGINKKLQIQLKKIK